ncbi:MAG: hypothetical protein ABIA67_05740 [Candidatus Margulisiibacteriota bacterium]
MDKKTIENIMKTPGEVRGAVFQTDAEYVKRHFGIEKLQKAKKQLNEWGYPIEYETIKAMEWYPAGLRALSLLAIKEAFSLNDEQIKDMGNEAPKHSFVIKLVMKFFLSIEKIFEMAPDIWKRHWSAGTLETDKYDKKSKTLTLRIKDLSLHPVFCLYEAGYFLRIAQYAKKSATVQQTKCTFRGDPYHEYTIILG